MEGVLRSLSLLGHYLVSFIGIVLGVSALELVEAKEKISQLKYYLEQEKTANADLFKKIDCSEKALFETRKMIDRRDVELEQTHRRIEILERWRSEAE